MSIRRRLILIVMLSAAVVTAAAAAIAQLVASTEDARIEAADAATEGVAEAIASAWTARSPAEGDGTLAAPGRELLRFFERATGAALSPSPRLVAGVCGGGTVLAFRIRGRRDLARAFALPPDQRAAIQAACAKLAGKIVHEKLRGDTLVIATSPAGPNAAFATSLVRPREGAPLAWKVELGILALFAILLVVVTLDAIVALRRGASQLDVALDRLAEDLNAPIVAPRAEELARIADGLRRMAARLAEAQERERALARDLEHEQRLAALGRVAAGVAHEVRNPLAGMKLRLDLMARAEGISDEQKADVDACLEEVARLDRVVRSLLDVARKDQRVEAGEVALGALVDERIALASTRADVSVARSGDGAVRADRDALARVLDNLVRNAIEASPSGGAVEVAIVSREGAVEVAVLDEGPGVPESRARELFEPFFTTKPEGTGLGLFMSRSLVRALGGTLVYARDHGRTRFSFELPAWRPS